MFDVYKSIWDVKVTGVISADIVKSKHAVSELRFLGCWVKRQLDMYTLDQIPYIEEKLAERGLDQAAGKQSLFDPQEGKNFNRWIEMIQIIR